MNVKQGGLKASALWYAQHLGWKVFPVHGVHDGKCTCNVVNCEHPGKHPRTAHGFKDATADIAQIERWWTDWPNANIGLATGEASGVDVLDVDHRACGDESLWELEKQHGELPPTVLSLTGGGGSHVFGCHVKGLKNQAGEIGEGLDFKTSGGYVILPPSNHISGHSYVWEGAHRPNEIELQPFPEWLLALIRSASAQNGNRTSNAKPVGDKIPQRHRNTDLTSLAGSMRRRGMTAEEIYAALAEVNRRRCDPPLAQPEIRKIAESVSRYPPWDANQQRHATRDFQTISEDCYRLTLAELGITFEIDRLRRERGELIGELAVHCTLPGTRSLDGSLSIADFNISSARARTDRAKFLAGRANIGALDWLSMVEEFCQLVLQTERRGSPAVDLRTLPKPAVDDEIVVDGFTLPRRHPTIMFGDGGAVKSYLGLEFLGRMAMQGISVAFFDWELAGDDHRDRLERLFGTNMPRITYVRCERPLVYEVDRLRRIVKENKIDFSIYDCIAFACDGPPEAAETAARYFRAIRQIGGGSLHIAHITKGEGGDQKPFGSAFWHNGARSTWYVERAEGSSDGDSVDVAFYNRKSNLSRLRSPLGFHITFDQHRTILKQKEVASNPDLAVKLTIRQRMAYLLKQGAMDATVIAEELDAELESVRRVARRYKGVFTVIQGGRIGLCERRADSG
jgi:hypothetical protein